MAAINAKIPAKKVVSPEYLDALAWISAARIVARAAEHASAVIGKCI